MRTTVHGRHVTSVLFCHKLQDFRCQVWKGSACVDSKQDHSFENYLDENAGDPWRKGLFSTLLCDWLEHLCLVNLRWGYLKKIDDTVCDVSFPDMPVDLPWSGFFLFSAVSDITSFDLTVGWIPKPPLYETWPHEPSYCFLHLCGINGTQDIGNLFLLGWPSQRHLKLHVSVSDNTTSQLCCSSVSLALSPNSEAMLQVPVTAS